jgi:hypothetical protein
MARGPKVRAVSSTTCPNRAKLRILPPSLRRKVGKRVFAAIIPDRLRSRVTGAFQAVNCGTRPLGALLGSVVGLRPALWVATLGGVAGFALLLPTPLPRYRLPAVDGPARS